MTSDGGWSRGIKKRGRSVDLHRERELVHTRTKASKISDGVALIISIAGARPGSDVSMRGTTL